MSTRLATLVIWGVLALGIVALWAAARLGRGRVARPSKAWGLLLRHPVGRVLLLVGWMWLGWHLFAR